ncbi:myosin II heavy chain [Mycena sp. CBHHK59/15]|nr:myosin II heavy chain [Mycena sp. CBHHK59/15]
MPAPRPSLSAEAARAAAQQAEFNEKKWVWVPDDKDGYLAGWVNKEEGESGEIIMAAGGDFRRVPLYALSKMNPPKFDRVEDIADLTFLNEASVVHNLRLRFGSGAIYTYSGLFLVAINPYQSLPLYSDAIIQQYRNKRRDENPPHIFAVAERAWVNMGEERENQSILITGESGAGKTESTKKVIQYLAAIATDVHPSHSRSPTLGTSTTMPSAGLPRSDSFRKGHAASPSISGGSGSHLTARGRLGLLERQILQANPILEAFGNAQTQRNNNSSRFGKFVRITFAPDGSIAGANIDWYLLEKSRVVVRSEAERSFHVFYQLMAGGGPLKDGVDDREEWSTLKGALDTFDLFRIVAAILQIGNIAITSTRADDAAERVFAEFTRGVLRPRVLAGREWVSQARTRQQALDELSALCKTLYEKSFGALVDRINRALDRPSSKSTFIGVLDIAGFEIFEINAYEQLLINYTNEKLQQFFNHHMFVLEQEEYAREGIKWDYVNFGLDLQPTIDLIEASGSVIGILSTLDEECIMPRATDLTFTNKLHGMWVGGQEEDDQRHPGRDKYEPSRFEQGFIIQHYAAKVEYRTDGWLEKNKDPLNDNLTRVLAASSDRYVASLFAEYSDAPVASAGPGGAGNIFTAGKKRAIKKGAFRTVAQRHKEQLSSLMSQLQATQPHFVRCIVPNSNKKPGRVDVPLVLDQLRCNGVLEGIRIARLGYPNRLPFVEFRQRYEVLTPGIIPRGYMDGREACRRMVKALELDDAIFKIGTSKIFFKAGVLAELEERRFSRLQAVARMWTARRQMKKVLNRAVAIRTIQRNARVYGELREWPWWQLYTKVRPLLAATRNDDELRKKEAELMLIKERAERDKQEREALENLKMSLEAEKRKVEEELEAERGLALDKDALLERSKMHESELEDEVAALQADLDLLDSQLDRVLKIQKESEEKLENLRQMFDQAAEHLVRLEAEQKEWVNREADLNSQLAEAQDESESLRSNLDELQKVSEELKNLALQREEDLARAKERSDITVKELEGKLDVELRKTELIKSQTEGLEEDARQAHQQLTEMARTATEYSNMFQKKEERIAALTEQVASMKKLHGESLTEILALQSDINTLDAQLEAERGDRENETEIRTKLQAELDELRALMEAKTSEATRRDEVEKSKEQELSDLRQQTTRLQQDLTESRRQLLDSQKQLKVDLDTLVREHASLQESHSSLSERERSAQSDLSNARAVVSELEKVKRSMESELLSLRTRQNNSEGQLADTRKAKEALERQLAAAHGKYHDIEDLMLQLERDKGTHDRQLEAARKQLEGESSKRAQLEQGVSSHKAELSKYKDRNTKLDRELNKALSELKAREWEVKQLESRQDKTIVEHVHVLEEAKRVTDRQLAEAQAELQKNTAYIRSLEKAKTRLAGEAEDMAREMERERVELRTREKAAKAQEQRAARALADVERDLEGKYRESTDMEVLRQRLTEELEDEREQHQKDLAERDFAADQTRKKYQELQSQRDNMSRLREDNRKIRSDYDELQLRYDDEVYNSGGWKKEKERMETKIGDITRAYESSTAAQAEQQSQIVTLHSQVRELRGVLDDAEADRVLLQKARRALQAELETIKLDHVDTNKMSSDREFQQLQLKKLDLERSLEEQEDRVSNAFDRMKKAETYANECQIELGKVRVDNSELDRLNANLEKQVKELNVRIVDLETKSYVNSPRPTTSRRMESRIEELTNQLNQTNKDRSDTSRLQRSADKIARDAKYQLAESDRQRAKLEEERRAYEAQILTLRQAMDAMQTEESDLQSAKRRAEREAADYKQKALNLERELERLRNRLDRPASTLMDRSPAASPRK